MLSVAAVSLLTVIILQHGSALLAPRPPLRSNRTMKNIRRYGRFLAFLFALPFVVPCTPGAQKSAGAREYLVYVGTYTRGDSKGIYVCRLDAGTGKLSALTVAGESVNPSFLTVHPNGKFLYAANEYQQSRETGRKPSAFAIDAASCKLTPLNTISSRGSGPCYVAVDKSGKSLLTANYGGGSVTAAPVNADGRLGVVSSFVQHAGSSVNPKRQQAPHAHSINFSRDNRFAVAADLGLDQLLVYAFDPVKSTLVPNNPPFAKLNPGAGPRHFAFDPKGRHGYVINELQSTVTCLAYDPDPRRLQRTSDHFDIAAELPGRKPYGRSAGSSDGESFFMDRIAATTASQCSRSTPVKGP